MKLKPAQRSEYLIDRYRVIFDRGAGWQCVCAEFTATGVDCRHARESQGQQAAQAAIATHLTRPQDHSTLLK